MLHLAKAVQERAHEHDEERDREAENDKKERVCSSPPISQSVL